MDGEKRGKDLLHSSVHLVAVKIRGNKQVNVFPRKPAERISQWECRLLVRRTSVVRN